MSMISKTLWNTYQALAWGDSDDLKCSRSHKTQSCVAVVVVKVKHGILCWLRWSWPYPCLVLVSVDAEFSVEIGPLSRLSPLEASCLCLSLNNYVLVRVRKQCEQWVPCKTKYLHLRASSNFLFPGTGSGRDREATQNVFLSTVEVFADDSLHYCERWGGRRTCVRK